MKLLTIMDTPKLVSEITKITENLNWMETSFMKINEVPEGFDFFCFDNIIMQDTYEDGDVKKLISKLSQHDTRIPNFKETNIIIFVMGYTPNPYFVEHMIEISKIGNIRFRSSGEIARVFKELISTTEGNFVFSKEKAGTVFQSEIPGLLNIIVADDSLLMEKIAEEAFKGEKYKLRVAKNGREAITLFMRERPDIIVTDIYMPIINGFELCRALKSNEVSKTVPILVISDSSQMNSIDEAFAAGADGYFFKSMSPDALRKRVESFFTMEKDEFDYDIIVAEDEVLQMTMAMQTLGKNGFRARLAYNGLDGIYMALRQKPDVLITDLIMPIMDGYEFASLIRRTESLADMKIVFATGRHEPHDQELAKTLGVLQTYVKPYDVEELAQLLKHLLLEKVSYYKAEYDLMLESIQSLALALDARDEYTRGHSYRVSKICGVMGNAMGMSKEKIDTLVKAAELHDIGKIGVRDDVLLKTGALNEAEYELIKNHATIGSKILGPMKSLSEITDIILHHHERWDGKGYPDALAEENIPLGSRVIAVADTFDAITSKRPYRSKMDVEEAIRIIGLSSGTQLCPRCVDAFMQVKDSIMEEI